MQRYSKEFKESIVKRMLPPENGPYDLECFELAFCCNDSSALLSIRLCYGTGFTVSSPLYCSSLGSK